MSRVILSGDARCRALIGWSGRPSVRDHQVPALGSRRSGGIDDVPAEFTGRDCVALSGAPPVLALSRRRIWRSSNAVQRGTHIRRHNRKRFDGAVAVVRSVAAAIRALRCVS